MLIFLLFWFLALCFSGLVFFFCHLWTSLFVKCRHAEKRILRTLPDWLMEVLSVNENPFVFCTTLKVFTLYIEFCTI